MAQHLNGILFFIGFNLLIGFTVSGIDNYAHIGGLVGGILLGLGFDGGGKRIPVARQVVTTLLVVGLGLALVLYRSAELTIGNGFVG